MNRYLTIIISLLAFAVDGTNSYTETTVSQYDTSFYVASNENDMARELKGSKGVKGDKGDKGDKTVTLKAPKAIKVPKGSSVKVVKASKVKGSKIKGSKIKGSKIKGSKIKGTKAPKNSKAPVFFERALRDDTDRLLKGSKVKGSKGSKVKGTKAPKFTLGRRALRKA
ncbi:hypothetical protein MPSEU_000856000 [Mayamaea pseudoterrestris]|nr:hypothetical protein MPSEU_000856000 [Mayamaea pseudoterrestris]